MSASRALATGALITGLVLGAALPASSSASVLRGEFQPLSQAGASIEGVAKLVITGGDRTNLSVEVSGLQPGRYASHLHAGPCSNTTSPHYKDDPTGPASPGNELWAATNYNDEHPALIAHESGHASGHGTVSWTPRPGPLSVVIHATDTGGPRLACADLS